MPRPDQRRGLDAIQDMLRWFASTQIRNVAGLASNIVNASPISDLCPVRRLIVLIRIDLEKPSTPTGTHGNRSLTGRDWR